MADETVEKLKEAKVKQIAEAKQKATDKDAFNKERIKLFKGTIVTVVVYGVLILLMSVGGILSDRGRQIIFEDGFAFTVTFISGTIIIILMLLIELFNYKAPEKPKPFAGENMSCPDFWELKKTPSDVLKTLGDTNSQLKELSRYYCQAPGLVGMGTTVMTISYNGAADGTRVGIGTTTSLDPALVETSPIYQLNDIGKKYNTVGIGTTYHINCNRIYPDYMSFIDRKEFPDSPTTLRCEYIKQCKSTTGIGSTGVQGNATTIPWTSVCKN